jgi:hypothetical protein
MIRLWNNMQYISNTFKRLSFMQPADRFQPGKDVFNNV